MTKLFLFIITISFFSFAFAQDKNQLQLGSDRLISEYQHLIKGKSIGLVTNHTGLLSNGKHIADVLNGIEGVKLVALFGPEHGVRGDAPAGEKITDSFDAQTGAHVYSLYGKYRKPTDEMLQGIDLLIYDIQDIGARFYTYISTLFYIVQTSAEKDIPLLVLDRPNPIDGISVDGPVRAEDQQSFVGIAPIPTMHGMTIGELAKLFAGEEYIGKGLKPNLTVIEMKNWKRDSYFDDYNLPWTPPSPNIPDLETAIVYPGICLIEGVNVSEGRGTYHPFLTIGAPYINSDELISKLNEYGHDGLKLEKIDFTPVSIEAMATSPKNKDEECYGIKLSVIDRKKFQRVEFGVKLVSALHQLYGTKLKFRDAGFDRLAGDKKIREMIMSDFSPEQIFEYWRNDLNKFLTIREKYLLY
ncbi:MAG: DUF1343 domain-containing protein [Ignavibacteriaceae bacterium]|nr:DUF1343 domain-containing protein [Ignavibacteriaceae bacterium]